MSKPLSCICLRGCVKRETALVRRMGAGPACRAGPAFCEAKVAPADATHRSPLSRNRLRGNDPFERSLRFGGEVLSAAPLIWQNLAHTKCWPEQDRSLRPETDAMNATALEEGAEWLVDAAGCDARQLSNLRHLQQVCGELVDALRLRVIGEPLWHQFPALNASGEAGGVTGLYLLVELHLACHTFHEH